MMETKIIEQKVGKKTVGWEVEAKFGPETIILVYTDKEDAERIVWLLKKAVDYGIDRT